MKLLFLQQALEDFKKINDTTLKSKISKTLEMLKSAKDLSEFEHIKKMHLHPDAYRIQIENYKLGFFYSENKITIARFLNIDEICNLYNEKN